MMHVKQIREVFDAGQHDEAQDALEQLLALGPSNIEALKLSAKLYESSGRFADEAQIWERVARVDREDPDAIAYFLRRQVEDREHFYFTDELPEGGRRFLAYPRGLINASAMGLVGCIAFLLSARLAQYVEILATPAMMLGVFGITVMGPWLMIVLIYVRGIKSITVTKQSFVVATRLRKTELAWDKIERVCLARASTRRGPHLSLIILPKDMERAVVEIDLEQGSTAVRARGYLIREIARAFSEPELASRSSLPLQNRRLQRF